MYPAKLTACGGLKCSHDELEFVELEYESIRAELSTRYTMLYQLASIAWSAVAAILAAIYLPPTHFYAISLFALIVVVLLGLIFASETVTLASMHFHCRALERRIRMCVCHCLPSSSDSWALFWHHRWGPNLRNIPGFWGLGVGAIGLYIASTLALFPALKSFAGGPGMLAGIAGLAAGGSVGAWTYQRIWAFEVEDRLEVETLDTLSKSGQLSPDDVRGSEDRVR